MNVYPDTTHLALAYLQLLKLFNWRRFCVIYGDQRGQSSSPVMCFSLSIQRIKRPNRWKTVSLLMQREHHHKDDSGVWAHLSSGISTHCSRAADRNEKQSEELQGQCPPKKHDSRGLVRSPPLGMHPRAPRGRCMMDRWTGSGICHVETCKMFSSWGLCPHPNDNLLGTSI